MANLAVNWHWSSSSPWNQGGSHLGSSLYVFACGQVLLDGSLYPTGGYTVDASQIGIGTLRHAIVDITNADGLPIHRLDWSASGSILTVKFMILTGTVTVSPPLPAGGETLPLNLVVSEQVAGASYSGVILQLFVAGI